MVSLVGWHQSRQAWKLATDFFMGFSVHHRILSASSGFSGKINARKERSEGSPSVKSCCHMRSGEEQLTVIQERTFLISFPSLLLLFLFSCLPNGQEFGGDGRWIKTKLSSFLRKEVD